MANGWSIFVGLAVIVAMCVGAWVFAPKGENQVYGTYFTISLPSRPPTSFTTPTGTDETNPLTFIYLSNPPPKNSLWRSSLILSFVSCYLMWAITFLAQLHPLIEPRRSDLRKDYVHH
ncbi:ATP synthase subunit H-domain-containing protein [Podospora appendiculata]|uniref:ATP synthase subunit H-domain-containing protein n=1 Tax=Podospora appendiculata TaxID=314037 RepID=A0AAE0X9D9_9PEZI|nr:ATP synthase subunit H-domain-containing protein [Podospora appendiculata]